MNQKLLNSIDQACRLAEAVNHPTCNVELKPNELRQLLNERAKLLEMFKRLNPIATAYTGIAFGPFSEFHKYAEQLLGRPIFTHQFGNKELMELISEKAKQDFVVLINQIQASIAAAAGEQE